MALNMSFDVSFLDAMEERRIRSSLSLSRAESHLSFYDGFESESASEDEGGGPADIAPATPAPRQSSSTRTRRVLSRHHSRHLPAALRSWQRSVAVPETTFSELEAKRRRRGHRASPCSRFVCAPDSVIALVFTMVSFLLTLTHVALLTPIFVAFDAPTRLGGPDPWPWEATIDFCVGLFFLTKVIMNFRTGVLVSSNVLGRSAVVLCPSDIAKVYIKSGTFRCDCVALIPLLVQCGWSLWLARAGSVEQATAAQLATSKIRLFRLLLLTRLRKLFGATVGDAEAAITGEAWTSPLTVWLIQTCGEFLFVINMCACFFIFTAQVEGFENSWLMAERNDIETDGDIAAEHLTWQESTMWDVYVAALYWATATVSTVGYGDVAAATQPERLVASCVMIVGSTWFAYLVGAIAALVNSHGAAARRRVAYREKMITLRCFLDRHPSVPRELRLRLVTFFSDTWIRKMRGTNDRALLRELPEDLSRETRFRALESNLRAAFGGKKSEVTEKAAHAVADALVSRNVPRGHVFDITEHFVMVNEGEVLVTLAAGSTQPGAGLVRRRTPGRQESNDHFVVSRGGIHSSIGVEAFCGQIERALARRRTQIVDAVAQSECEVYELDAERAARLGDEFPDLRVGALLALALPKQ